MVPGAEADSHAEVVAPYDGSLVATVETAGLAAVEHALETAHGLFRNRDAWLGSARRVEILERTASLMQDRRQELAITKRR